MDAALNSHFDLDSMYTYSPASKCSSALPHQPSRSPRHDQYEISGLALSVIYKIFDDSISAVSNIELINTFVKIFSLINS